MKISAPMSVPDQYPLRAGRRAAHPCRRWFIFPALLSCAGVVFAQPLVPFTDVVDFATGRFHACAVTSAGTVKCWGANSFGQVGDGTVERRYAPVTIIQSGAVAVDAGREHSCALMATGTIKCWGDNGLGALGDGTTEQRLEPVDVINLDNVIDIAVGSGHTCALRSTDDRVLCWGFNGFGQLGTGDTVNQSSPVTVATSGRFVQISAGQDNVCGVTTTGSVACWGVYDRRCTSFGCAFDFFVSPNTVPGLTSGISQVTAGEYFQCALSDAGSVQCWGDNYDGQLGDLGTPEPPPFDLVAIDGLQSGVSGVDAGDDHACARLADGSARCWGRNGGRLGDGTNTERYPPVVVTGLSDTFEIQAGGTFSCAREGADNALLCWGQNTSGQLGDNDPPFRIAPTQVVGLTGSVSDLTAGEEHSCAVLNNGEVRCWGGNGFGQLGDGTGLGQRAPVKVAGLTDIVSMDAGYSHTCAVSGSGEAYCWGLNDVTGQVGNGSFAEKVVLVPNLVVALDDVQVATISAGQFHTCASTTSNLAKCWGSNLDDQLAGRNIGFASEPITVPNLFATVVGITAGGRHSCAVRTGGELRCWGDNTEGQIGDGTTDDAPLPTAISAPPQSVSSAEAGDTHTCAIAAGGSVYCWGGNNAGQLGRGFTGFRSEIPLQVNGLSSGVTQISTSFAHNCVIRPGGSVSCWGLNVDGQLGDGTTTTQSEPVAVVGLPSAALHIAAGSSHTCAATQNDGVYCWGDNATGQLGIGGRDLRTPGAVLNDPSLFRSSFEAGEGPG